MSLDLPTFEESFCQMLSVCVDVETAEQNLLSVLSKPADRIAYYLPPPGTAYVRVFIPGGEHTHFHVDCALSSAFAPGDRPKPSHRKAEALALLRPFFEAPVAIRTRGNFRVSSAELSDSYLFGTERIRALLGPGTRRIYAGMELEGSALTEAGFVLDRAEDELRAHLELEHEETFNSGVLIRAFRAVDGLLGRFLGVVGNANR